ncbi:GTP diphosphokinase [Natronospirillum operosum]|uniref:GTP pyrophosphokinase n=1 Tax=Natronospirillum operosum TaxID=2759953 RepID=A0A4Z0W325_9GAMM|nr:GTP diphosphokinase [Natronospirillum operosum]TGG91097.1 GTP diphosphokinase [Natronospirillum operosum]
MVKVRDEQPISMDGTVNLEAWMQRLRAQVVVLDEDELLRACRIARRAEEEALAAENMWSEGTSSFRAGLEMAEILAGLKMDQETLEAAILYRSVREGKLPLDTVQDQFGPEVAKLVDGVLRMAAIQQKHRGTRKSVLGQSGSQAENVRRMLVAMINDVRVALIKIAERTCAIRAVKNAPAAKRYRVAREVADIYAPLAHRLGIGHIKWELEDLSFRYLYPTEYKKIARLLDEKRLDREAYVRNVLSILQEKLDEAGIKGLVHGRVKHIYSIWRKMRRKNISFSQVYDIRAMRILVPEVRDCYSVLGIVHSTWRNIPKEFDDYIASPKPNGYRSLHTAVIGPEGKVVEIQIRTEQMHEDAELGVCAHWRYKGTDVRNASQGYEDKMAWLRQVLEWHDELAASNEHVDDVRREVTNDRIYVLTPEGHIVDMPAGATPVDFAYRVHTEVGHACRGAKVNGRMVPLNHTLQIGDQVEVLTGANSHPSRDWLNSDLGYVNTSRARAKVAAWFKEQDREQNEADGKQALLREIKRFGLSTPDFAALARTMKQKSADDLFAAIGSGDMKLMQVVHALEREQRPEPEMKELPTSRPKDQGPIDDDLYIQGVGNLLTTMAGCCKPVPGDAIVGYVTQGRGVSIHREDCVNLLQLRNSEPERIIEVSWGREIRHAYPVDVMIEAHDRTGLLRDIMMVLANAHVNVLAANTLTDKSETAARIKLTLEIDGLQQLSRVFSQIEKIPNIVECRRQSQPVSAAS